MVAQSLPIRLGIQKRSEYRVHIDDFHFRSRRQWRCSAFVVAIEGPSLYSAELTFSVLTEGISCRFDPMTNDSD